MQEKHIINAHWFKLVEIKNETKRKKNPKNKRIKTRL
jgi:hypothetical protein